MKIQLSDHFSYKRLLRFVAPSILMLLCTSVYSIVDGFFVSNYVGKTPFAALNLVMPVLMGVGTLGFMAGTGGSAVVSMTLGEGRKELANEYFSLIVYVTLAVSIVVGFICFALAPQIALALGADGELEADCVRYSRILFLSSPPARIPARLQCVHGSAMFGKIPVERIPDPQIRTTGGSERTVRRLLLR